MFFQFCGVHPGRLAWNIIIEVGKIIFLSKWVIWMFHVNLPGGICKINWLTGGPPSAVWTTLKSGLLEHQGWLGKHHSKETNFPKSLESLILFSQQKVRWRSSCSCCLVFFHPFFCRPQFGLKTLKPPKMAVFLMTFFLEEELSGRKIIQPSGSFWEKVTQP